MRIPRDFVTADHQYNAIDQDHATVGWGKLLTQGLGLGLP